MISSLEILFYKHSASQQNKENHILPKISSITQKQTTGTNNQKEIKKGHRDITTALLTETKKGKVNHSQVYVKNDRGNKKEKTKKKKNQKPQIQSIKVLNTNLKGKKNYNRYKTSKSHKQTKSKINLQKLKTIKKETSHKPKNFIRNRLKKLETKLLSRNQTKPKNKSKPRISQGEKLDSIRKNTNKKKGFSTGVRKKRVTKINRFSRNKNSVTTSKKIPKKTNNEDLCKKSNSLEQKKKKKNKSFLRNHKIRKRAKHYSLRIPSFKRSTNSDQIKFKKSTQEMNFFDNFDLIDQEEKQILQELNHRSHTRREKIMKKRANERKNIIKENKIRKISKSMKKWDKTNPKYLPHLSQKKALKNITNIKKQDKRKSSSLPLNHSINLFPDKEPDGILAK
ncbi:hypothetical protein M0813_03754 [Anaeramoeba flamelloides]|uniref:Uncharacterized protein n=1 Tax=Anaeramoeba flamelloides TaxID=1746091 RepID=A0ABQ8XUD6_9EUKA|nr:hypothetical protein M0813_03754 [Anaeramoeba flamelloides]